MQMTSQGQMKDMFQDAPHEQQLSLATRSL